MVRRSGVCVARLKLILSRQEPPRYGSNYIPSTLATTSEAPSISRPAILNSTKLGRGIHAMGQPEVHAILLALYHPWLFELHEQKMLHRWPSTHPLAGIPEIDVTKLQTLRGTVSVAERLGYLDLCPIIYVPDPSVPGQKARVVFPYQGDLLLFLKSSDVDPYCVNWTVKNRREDFTKPGPDKRVPNGHDRRMALARYEIEVAYYLDANIRTQPVANEDIDWEVAANLRMIFPYTCKALSVNVLDRRNEIVDAYRSAMALGIPPMDVMASLEMRGQCTGYDAAVIFYKSIWERDLRVNLFKPILVDYPLEPENVDVLSHYASWYLP